MDSYFFISYYPFNYNIQQRIQINTTIYQSYIQPLCKHSNDLCFIHSLLIINCEKFIYYTGHKVRTFNHTTQSGFFS